MHAHECRCPWSQKRASVPLELELQVVVSCRMWMPNSCPLQEQGMLLSTKPSFQPEALWFLKVKHESRRVILILRIAQHSYPMAD